MLRANETEDPKNAKIEEESEKIYHGPGYWRRGNHYHFGARVQPSPAPPRISSGGAGPGSMSDRLANAKREQEAHLEELNGKLQIFANKTLDNLRNGGPIIRGEFASIKAEIEEREFLCQIIQGAISRMENEQKDG